jgi:hypothetical protein
LTFSSVTDSQTRAFLQERNIPSLAKPFEVADLISQVRGLTQRPKKAEKMQEKVATAGAGS